MLTRRDFLGKALAGAAAGSVALGSDALAAGRLAWPGPIGLELYTVRQLLAQSPASTLKSVAAIGYKEVEVAPYPNAAEINRLIRADGLTAPSGYFNVPKNLDEMKKALAVAHGVFDVRYFVVGDNPKLDADQWRRRADFFNECGRVSQQEAIQFCYHAHFHELASIDHTTGYDIMLKRCDPKYLKMEMDVFWVTYAGKDPLTYWRRYPGRFPLLHIKDMRRGVKISPQESPHGQNPFTAVGQGRIDWRRIFAHTQLAGVKHIFVEQDRCNRPPLEAIKVSYQYLKNLRLS
ncbi:MAG: sugar phosphate isomerase/epimerase family protein [Terriglobia bacterium]